MRQADTSLLAEVEHDFAHYGDELTTGAGKCMRDGKIVAIGKAGNPDVMDGVDMRLRCGPNTK